jgi:hypothetical protein
MIIVLCFPVLLIPSPFSSHAILFENGTFTNENFTKNFTTSANQTINTNGTINDFLENLPSDNTILAESVYQKQ